MKRIHKYIILTFFITMFCLTASAQSGLRFSSVKLVGSTDTVPVNKVWKIESVLASDRLVPPTGVNDNTYYTIDKSVIIDGTSVFISRASRYTENAGRYNSESATDIGIGQTTELPLWLPENTTIAPGNNVFRISVIEFDVLP